MPKLDLSITVDEAEEAIFILGEYHKISAGEIRKKIDEMSRQALIKTTTSEDRDCRWRHTRLMPQWEVLEFLNRAGAELGRDDFELVGSPTTNYITIFYYSSLDLEKLLE